MAQRPSNWNAMSYDHQCNWKQLVRPDEAQADVRRINDLRKALEEATQHV